jgi:hypothetical protein
LEDNQLRLNRLSTRTHKRKFDIATKNLPHDCVILFSPWDSKNVIADFEARMSVLYRDIADSADAVKPVSPVDKALLKKVIENFRTIALRINT